MATPKILSRSKDGKVTTTALIRRDFSWNWRNTNPVLADEELGYEVDSDTFKLGDGKTKWLLLKPYSKEVQ